MISFRSSLQLSDCKNQNWAARNCGRNSAPCTMELTHRRTISRVTGRDLSEEQINSIIQKNNAKLESLWADVSVALFIGEEMITIGKGSYYILVKDWIGLIEVGADTIH